MSVDGTDLKPHITGRGVKVFLFSSGACRESLTVGVLIEFSSADF